MKENEFIIRGGAEVEVVSRVEICKCRDGRGCLLFDFRQNKFIREKKCKLFLLCTIIRMHQFKSKMSKNNLGPF